VVAAAAQAPPAPATTTRVASAAPAQESEGFFASFARKVGLKSASPETTATATPSSTAKPKVAEAKPLPKAFKPAESKPVETKQAAIRPPLKPSVAAEGPAQAPAAAEAATAPKDNLVAGAQPIVSANSFESRFSAMK